jgi:hypothetical protein
LEKKETGLLAFVIYIFAVIIFMGVLQIPSLFVFVVFIIGLPVFGLIYGIIALVNYLARKQNKKE